MDLIFVALMTLSLNVPLNMVVAWLFVSAWSNPCKYKAGSASAIASDTPLPVARNFSSGRFGLLESVATDEEEVVLRA